MKLKLVLSLIMLVIVILTFVLFIFNQINASLFWIVVLVAAIYSYGIMPRMKK